jgi:hypothetical protein
MYKFLWVALVFIGQYSFAQTWMPGYEFRRKITFDKTKIEGTFSIFALGRVDYDMPDFPVLIELQDEAFKYRTTSCDGVVYDTEGTNVAFATAAAPAVKLSFQIESYDPILGKYRFWVRVPILATAKTATPATAIYFYYAGSVLHDSFSSFGLNTWNESYLRVWHMNGENSDLGSPNVKSGAVVDNLKAHGLGSSNKISGKIGEAIGLNGQSQFFHANGITINSFTVSAWVKWDSGTDTQVIVTNDSLGVTKNGWQLRVDASGRPEMTTYRATNLFFAVTSPQSLNPGVWNHVAGFYAIQESGSSTVSLFLNGKIMASTAGSGIRLGQGGDISVGRNKNGTQYFNGAIDELRIVNAAQSSEWIKNEYTNQSDPASFYVVGLEEYNPSWANFTGAVSSVWTIAGNWSNGVRPVNGGKIRIESGKTARITGTDMSFGQLIVEPGATLSSAVNLQLDCSARLGAGAVLNIDAGKKLTLGGEGVTVSGPGSIHTDELEMNGLTASSEMFLEADVEVSKYLRLTRGKLSANGKLTLLSGSTANTAALLPVTNVNEVSVAGEVNVQRHVSGHFPPPATARGWRLLSSPVYTSDPGGSKSYTLKAVQNSVFVTGVNEAANGFDNSPNHGATIYTHDQSRAGTLAEKYAAIPDMNTVLTLGKGFYLYSRGNRNEPDAYQNQIQQQPFVNPAPYTINYKGNLFIGDLTINVSNKNSGAEGDGFNLIGNPYASPVLWGSLNKVNLQDAVWLFDPLNNSYYSSSDPATVIPSGAGFFVRVKSGFTSGSIGFTEQARYTGMISVTPVLSASRSGAQLSNTAVKNTSNELNSVLKVLLSKDGFFQPFELKYNSSGKSELNNGDALKIGDGYVSIGSLSADGVKLSIDERGGSDDAQEIKLFVKGYEKGSYQLRFNGIESFPSEISIILRDHYLKTVTRLNPNDSLFNFEIDTNVPESYGENRFVLVLNGKDIGNTSNEEPLKAIAYPNPFTDQLYLKVNEIVPDLFVNITDVMGKRVWSKGFGKIEKGNPIPLEITGLNKGIYVVQVFDGRIRIGAGFKVLKR